MSTNITNYSELAAEIARLKVEKTAQEAFLQQQYNMFCYKMETPVRVAKMVTSRIPGAAAFKEIMSGVGSVTKSNAKGDWLTRGLQLALPLVLNRTLLKKAGWLKKGLVLLVSETAASQVNQNRISNVVDRVASFIKPKKKAKVKPGSTPLNTPADPHRSPMITAEESVRDDDIYGARKDNS